MTDGIRGKLYGIPVIAGNCDCCGEIKEYDDLQDGDKIPLKWICKTCKINL